MTPNIHRDHVSAVERVVLLLVQRYKKCNEEACTNGGSLFKIECLAEVIIHVAEPCGGSTTPGSRMFCKELAELTSHPRPSLPRSRSSWARYVRDVRLVSRPPKAVMNPARKSKGVISACSTRGVGHVLGRGSAAGGRLFMPSLLLGPEVHFHGSDRHEGGCILPAKWSLLGLVARLYHSLGVPTAGRR